MSSATYSVKVARIDRGEAATIEIRAVPLRPEAGFANKRAFMLQLLASYNNWKNPVHTALGTALDDPAALVNAFDTIVQDYGDFGLANAPEGSCGFEIILQSPELIPADMKVGDTWETAAS